MTSKDRVIKAFSGEKADQVPVGIFLGGSWPIIKAGTTLEKLIGDPKRTAEIFYQTNERLNADLFMIGTGATALLIKALGGEVRFNNKGAPVILNELIKTESDLVSLKVADAINNPAINWIRETAKEVHKLAGEERFILVSGRAPFTLAGQLYGLENLSRAIYKNREFVNKLLEFTTELSLAYFKPFLEDGFVDGLFIADPTASGDVISKKHFEEFALPFLQRVIDLTIEYEKLSMVHICGDISDRIGLLATTGVNSISIDTKVNISQAKKLIGNKICLAGNVHPVDILQFGSRKNVFDAATVCMDQGARNGGFVLMPGCDLEAGVCEDNVKELVHAANAWVG